MLKFKNTTTLIKIQLRFKSLIKPKITPSMLLQKFSTQRIISNKAPKHFNIGQHSFKVRTYFGEYTHSLSANYLGLGAQKVMHSAFFNSLLLSKNMIIRGVRLTYTTKFKFN